MSKILIQNAIITDASSAFNGQQADVFVENGIIKDIGKGLNFDGAEVVSGEDLYISAGWFDMRANFRDPGEEFKEDIYTGSQAAAYGGFTGVALLPETQPAVTSKAQVEYIRNRSEGQLVSLYSTASIYASKENNSLTDMLDTKAAGAVAFSSGYKNINDGGFLMRAMQYAQYIKTVLILYPEDAALAGKGVMHEGLANVQVGMRGRPDIAEQTEIQRVISICRYVPTPIHFSCISSRKSVELIKNAQAEGLPVTADVSANNLYFAEDDLLTFNTNLKLRPPLRSEEDKIALREAVLNGIISTVVSDHAPHEEDVKHCEFELAAWGAAGIQTVFSQLIEVFGKQNIPRIIEVLTKQPRQILNLPLPSLNIGNEANFTVFNANQSWQLNEVSNKSKSKNSPLWGKTLKGKAVAVMNKGHFKLLN